MRPFNFSRPRVRALFPLWIVASLTALGVVLAARRGQSAPAADAIIQLLEIVIQADENSARQCLATLSGQLESGEFTQQRLRGIQPRLAKIIEGPLADTEHALHLDAARLAIHWNDRRAVSALFSTAKDSNQTDDARLVAARSLLTVGGPRVPQVVSTLLKKTPQNTPGFRARLIGEVAKASDLKYAHALLAVYTQSESDLQPRIVEALLQRAAWSKLLLRAIGHKTVPRDVLHANQIARLQASPDKDLAKLVREQWGVVRLRRDPSREKVLTTMRNQLRSAQGDAVRGQLVFAKICGQCHSIYGKGPDVGPDITRNGRGSFEQLLSNVFDPNLVIGASYQARTVITDEGRVLTGLLAEDNPQRVVLKMQGGKREIIPRNKIDEMAISPLSLMPENLEQQLKPGEIADLFDYLTLDQPPQNPQAKRIPGSPSFTQNPDSQQ